MWWLYIKIEENEDRFVYLYSRESKEPDGEIVYDRKKEEWEVTRPCLKDFNSPFNIDAAERKFWHVVEEGFPDRRMVAIG